MTLASWYGPGFNGRPTSSGEIYNQNALTAASRSLPLGTHVRVTNLDNGRSVVVKINDRGPYVRGRGIDLSKRAAQKIGLAHKGVGSVRISRLDAPANEAGSTWEGRVRMVQVHRIRRRHTYYASHASGTGSPRMVSNPIGDWLLESLSPLRSF